MAYYEDTRIYKARETKEGGKSRSINLLYLPEIIDKSVMERVNHPKDEKRTEEEIYKMEKKQFNKLVVLWAGECSCSPL